MKLKRLIIQGFKSFKDRTTVHFDDGITGIVGPNGCGKSNIVDALFWVMGEQSAKHLRGNTMKDVIFSGTSKYGPASFAEASLVLGNEEAKHIHIGNKVSSPSEIKLTRKLYRNGDTEYRINDIPCRLKDIQEVFMDTGAGAKSYSIIAQGEINKLVQAKPIERRTMIEEVAGITKFKLRRRDSLKKIEQTQANLSRLKDLQQEIEKNLRLLQKQAEKAERAKSLKEKVKRNDLVVHSHEVFEHLKTMREARTFITEQSLEIGNWQTRRNTLEVDLEEERLKKLDMTVQVEELQSEYNELSKELAASEEKLNYLCKSLTEKESILEGKSNESDGLAEERAEIVEKLETQRENFDSLKSVEEEGFNFSDLEELVNSLKDQLDDGRTSLHEFVTELEEKKTASNTVDQEIFRSSSKMEEYSKSLEDITEEAEALENQYSGVNNQIANERDEVNQLESGVGELELKTQKAKVSLEESRKLVSEMETLLRDKTSNLIKVESKLTSLVDLNNSMEGVKQGVGEFLKTNNNSEKYKLLGSAVRCEDKYSRAVQNVLTDLLDTIILSEDGIAPVYDWFNTAKENSIDVLSLKSEETQSGETLERLKVVLSSDDIIPFAQVVSFDESIVPAAAKNILNGHYLVESLSTEQLELVESSINFKSIVSADGSCIIKNQGVGKVISFRSTCESDGGVVNRNNTIEKLTVELEGLASECEIKETELSELEQKNTEAIELFEATRDDLSEQKTEYASKKSALESKLANFESNSSRLDILNNRKKEISKSRLEIMENEEEINNNKADLQDRVEALQEQTEELRESMQDLDSQYQSNKEELVEKKVQAQSFEQRLTQSEALITDIELQIERVETRIENNIESIDTYKEDILNITTDIESVEEGNHSKATDLEDKQEVLDSIKEKFTVLLQAMQDRENEVKELTKKSSKIEKDLVAFEIKLGKSKAEEEQVTRNIFEKYRIDLRKVLTGFLEFEDEEIQDLHDVSSIYTMETEEGLKEIEIEPYDFNRRYGQDLKDCSHKLKTYKNEYSRLGEINWQAVEDYERQKLRFDFLNVQEQELAQSLEDLQTAIEHIDVKSRERFKMAFNEVNMRFEKVFPIIFGGGNAELKLVGDVDDPDCGVDIIAQPPGKKMQNINLMSGGEKAMTAVSLIFSIFLVKPSPFCLLDEVDAPLDDANVGRFNELLREMSSDSQFILITHNKKTMELNDSLYGVTMQEPGVSKAVSVQLH